MGYASALTTALRQAAAAPVRGAPARTTSPAPCGNQAALRRLQTKLKVGAVNDPLEHEADRVADQVMRMADPGAAMTSAPPQVSRKCAACEQQVSRKRPACEAEEKLQKKGVGSQAGPADAPASVHEALRSPGQPLDAATRAYFEPRFGRDFSDVQVHSGPSAAQSAHDVNAHAYTVGHSIAFDSGRFDPGSREGRRLIAHELTHVAQQQGGNHPPNSRILMGSMPEAVSETEAERIADSTVAPRLKVWASNEALRVARQPKETAKGSSHADEVIKAINFPVEQAAIRNTIVVNNILTSLPMNELLATLLEVRYRGTSFDLLVGFAEIDHFSTQDLTDRVLAALYTIRWSGTNAGKESIEEAQTAATVLKTTSSEDLKDILNYLKGNPTTAQRVSLIMEGADVLQEAQSGAPVTAHLQTDFPSAVGGTGAGSYAAPPTIGPGPWNPPGKQPIPWYIGNEAHSAIAQVYDSAHLGDITFYNFIEIGTILNSLKRMGVGANSSAVASEELGLKPDIANLTQRHIYEIKSVNGLAEGIAESKMYIRIFKSAGVEMSPGPTTEDGTMGAFPAPDGVFIFESPVPGVIVYRYRKGRLVPVPVPQEAEAYEPSEVRWRYDLEPWQKAIIVETAVVGVGIIVLMVLFAPVGA